MRFPVDNYYTDWNGTAGYGYGDITSYGRHDGVDINDNSGGNSDLGKPLYAISKGKIVGIHKHTGTGNFGNHFFLMIEGNWGIRYIHYAHCLELFIENGQEVNEGQKIATVGNSGTIYAHVHFAVKKKPSGMDDVANNKTELNDIWEDPIAFIEKYLTPAPQIPTELDKLREERDRNWNLYQDQLKINQTLQNQIIELNKTIDELRNENTDLKEQIASGTSTDSSLQTKLNILQTKLNILQTEREKIRKIIYDKWSILPGKYYFGKQLHRIKYIYEN